MVGRARALVEALVTMHWDTKNSEKSIEESINILQHKAKFNTLTGTEKMSLASLNTLKMQRDKAVSENAELSLRLKRLEEDMRQKNEFLNSPEVQGFLERDRQEEYRDAKLKGLEEERDKLMLDDALNDHDIESQEKTVGRISIVFVLTFLLAVGFAFGTLVFGPYLWIGAGLSMLGEVYFGKRWVERFERLDWARRTRLVHANRLYQIERNINGIQQ